ncbi:Hypothetical protein PHPALM_18522 [Phytophthora palmivora]|uniref:Uncharacterized protein n=1 Tax=Phytophthora palmivora TaxID=4796 RepID=A0A2P4XJI7_9STRA|nr:Hypothetical protein PHPALM_18522 [Phytophthora palmivora]
MHDTVDQDTQNESLLILAFFGHICSTAHARDRDNLDSNEAPTVPLSAACVGGLRRVLEGYEKVINNLKKRCLVKINEGKRQLKASGYELLAEKLMAITPVKECQSWSTVLFGWGYFVLM